MQIQPVVIGTAGHIDHGKSSLVRALTGIDPDRLKEEKERGLTIDLGFARMALPDGRTVGLIDVPGHERFIRNMVAGATGIDLVLLVVAADDGVMPQTREHLDIMGLLGLQRGVVALNKIDLVEEDMCALAEEDVRATLAGTFLADAPIVRVSAATGEGLEALRAELARLSVAASPRAAEGVFRMSIQRVFSARGFGTVLTGIPVSGRVQPGQVLEVLPGGQRGRVRGLQAYGAPAESARAGHSTAINLTDVDHALVQRGHVVAEPNYFSPARMVAARLRVLPSLGFAVTDRMEVRLHTGTADPLGELVLLDQRELAPGAEGLVQVRLQEPVVCAPGDPFVLRRASPSVTLGGGVILEESRHRLKRFKGFVIEELALQERALGSPEMSLEAHLARQGLEPATAFELAQRLKRPHDEVARFLEDLRAQGRVAQLGPQRWVHTDRLEEGLARVRREVDAHFAREPHRAVVESLELKRATGFEGPLLTALLEELARRNVLALEPGGLVRVVGRKLELDEAALALRARVLAAMEQAAFQPPSPEELALALDVPLARVEKMLALCVDQGALVSVGKGLYLDAAARERAREAVVRNCQAHGELAIPQLRDALNTSRKFLIPLLEHFDLTGVTLRQGGHRVLKKR